jgi:filamentous hemagglutinin family protein
MNKIHCISSMDKRCNFALKGLAASLMLAFGSGVCALPSGGTVSAGSASVASGAGTMTINQTSQNAALNWQSFSIGQSEAVRFVQPNSGSVALNRVLGSDPSNILGSLSANGKVFLVNPNGVLFAKGAQVNVGGLVASTRDISDSDFMAGVYKFAGSGNGTVVNQGSINADGGYVALLGASVSNEGVISARLGTVALAAGNAITLDVAGDGLLNVAVNQGALNALAQNGGLIQANGGQVLLTALSAGNLLQSAVNNTGIVQAQTVENRNGVIRLLGDMQSGIVSVGGTLDASGTGSGQTGGSVTVTGHHAGLFGGRIDASGDAGGGTVLVGGGFQGNNPAVQNATATYMSADSAINADAVTRGNGGTVVLWANDSTRARGSISARGGAQGGDGGLVETSAHWLDVVGIKVNAGAPNGKSGTWLLDPADVTIEAVTANEDLAGGVFTPSTGQATASVSVADIIFGLASSDVTINTVNNGVSGGGAGNITVLDAITWGTVNTLTLNAVGNINVNAAISPTEGNLNLISSGTGNVNVNADIDIVRGNLVVCCGGDINVNARIRTVDGSILLSAGQDLNIVRTALTPLAGVTATRGNISLCAGRDINLDNLDGAALITITNGSVIDGEDLENLGVPLGLTLRAGTAGTGPGPASGTVNFIGTARAVATGTAGTGAPVTLFYNPVSYSLAGSTDYLPRFTLTDSTLTQFMLVYPGVVDKEFDGTTDATLAGFKTTVGSGPLPLSLILDPGGTAFFDTPDEGIDKLVTFSGVTITQDAIVTGGSSTNFALVAPCCDEPVRTTGNIVAAPVPPGPTPGETVVPILPVFYASTVLAGLNLDVGGIRMPPVQVAEIVPVEQAPQLSGFTDAPVVVPPPPVYAPPVMPRRPDRN